MAKFLGAVRFPDGDLRYFIYNGMTDMARPKLFVSEVEASNAWDDPQSDVPMYAADPATDELVEVMPYGENKVCFRSYANRSRNLITGPLDLERAVETGLWQILPESLCN